MTSIPEKPTSMTSAQYAYALARAYYDSTKASCDAIARPLFEAFEKAGDYSDDAINSYLDNEERSTAHFDLGGAFELLRNAERALLADSLSRIENNGLPANIRKKIPLYDIRYMFEVAPQYADKHADLINICFRVNWSD